MLLRRPIYPGFDKAGIQLSEGRDGPSLFPADRLSTKIMPKINKGQAGAQIGILAPFGPGRIPRAGYRLQMQSFDINAGPASGMEDLNGMGTGLSSRAAEGGSPV